MSLLLPIAVGGALGAVSRYLVAGGIYRLLGTHFPYGTLTVNLLGSLMMGLLSFLLLERLSLAPAWRAALMVGFLGAFTTFSTFSLETVNLLQQGANGRAVLNMLFSAIGCTLACWLGIVMARLLTGDAS